MTFAWMEQPISRSHDRKVFDCGEPALNDYLLRYARQNHEAGGAKTFVALRHEEPLRIVGYYSLSITSLQYHATPEVFRRGLGRYDVPVFRLARLAVDKGTQGQGLGSALLGFALQRCLLASQHVAGVALLIDAKNDQVAAWYESFGALRTGQSPPTLLLPLDTASAAQKG